MEVYLEIGTKKTFAGAVDWPGWCRSGRDEASALQALFDYAPRYAGALAASEIGFEPPHDASAFTVVERLPGTATTDFGAPDGVPSVDVRPLDEGELQRQIRILQACWNAFDEAVAKASGRELRLGPRGGGRDLEGMIRHIYEADAGYLSRLAVRLRIEPGADMRFVRKRIQDRTLETLHSAVRDGLPQHGPRGGKLWAPRYFIRRMAWHELDHAWELVDRIL